MQGDGFAVDERAGADARALQVLHDGDDAPRLAGEAPDGRDSRRMGVAVVVGEVEAGHVGARFDEAAQRFLVVGCWARV